MRSVIALSEIKADAIATLLGNVTGSLCPFLVGLKHHYQLSPAPQLRLLNSFFRHYLPVFQFLSKLQHYQELALEAHFFVASSIRVLCSSEVSTSF